MIDENQVKIVTEKLFLNVACENISDTVAGDVIEYISGSSLYELLELISKSEYEVPSISAANISQFSQFSDIDKVIRIVMDSGYENISFVDIGYFLIGKKLDGAKRKYGENHYKLCSQLGLANEGEPHEITWLGQAYRKIEDPEKKKVVSYKLALRVPIVQKIMINAQSGIISGSSEMLNYLSDSTMRRRRSNIKKLFTQLYEFADDRTKYIFENIRW